MRTKNLLVIKDKLEDKLCRLAGHSEELTRLLDKKVDEIDGWVIALADAYEKENECLSRRLAKLEEKQKNARMAQPARNKKKAATKKSKLAG